MGRADNGVAFVALHPQLLLLQHLEHRLDVALDNASSKELAHRCIAVHAMALTHPWELGVGMASLDIGPFVVDALRTVVDQLDKEP